MEIASEICYQEVKDTSTNPEAREQDTNIWFIAGITFLLGIVVFLGACFLLRFRSEGDKNTKEFASKRWYREQVSKDEEAKFLHFTKNTDGCFLFKRVTRPSYSFYTLVVLVERRLRYLSFSPTNGGFKCHSTYKSFPSLSDAVNYYREHDIKVGNTVWGKLTYPLEWEPEEDWYFGQLAEKHRDKMLKSEENGPGSFLMSLSNKDDNGYDLAVNVRGEVYCFGIIPEDDGFRMLDTGEVFTTLSELVSNYKVTNLTDRNGQCVILGKPCTIIPDNDVEIISEPFTLEMENEFLRSRKTRQGSYLIVQENVDINVYMLAVYFKGEIQRFSVKKSDQGYNIVKTAGFFHSLSKLLDHYRENKITTDDKTWGRLTKPFKREPKEDWYVGALSREDEEKILLSRRNRPGAFLIRDSMTDPDNYVLACKLNGGPERHVIVWESAGFTLINVAKHFTSLSELVQYYQEHSVPPCDASNARRLSEPCAKAPPAVWFSERLTGDDEIRYKRSRRTRLGSFLITKKEHIPAVYILAVYFDGKITKFQVTEKENGFVFETTGMFFYTWHELVRYYKSNDIKCSDRSYGKLCRPLIKEPTEKWYFESAKAEDEPSLFRDCEEGSFLVRDGITESGEYVLAVMLNGEIKRFTIMPVEDGFRLGGADTSFETLGQLVEHYKSCDISTGERYGKLQNPVQQQKKT